MQTENIKTSLRPRAHSEESNDLFFFSFCCQAVKGFANIPTIRYKNCFDLKTKDTDREVPVSGQPQSLASMMAKAVPTAVAIPGSAAEALPIFANSHESNFQ